MPRKKPKTLTPTLRFPEFRNAPRWEETHLGKVAEIKLGKMLDRKKHTTGHLLPYLNNVSLRWNEVDTSNLPEMYFGDDELDRFGLKAGDVVVCEGGEPGRSAVWDGRIPELKFQKAVHRVRFKVAFEPRLLVMYLAAISGTTQFESLFTGGGIKHLTRETFARLRIPIIPPAEQQKIAACLGSVDDLIAAAGRKLAALRDHKRGLMQQLFPQPGETQPRLRFPEFRDEPEWKEDRLSRHINLVSGVHLSPSGYSEQGEMAYFTGPSDFTNSESRVSKWTTSTGNKGVAGDILITVKGSGVGELWYLELSQAALGRQLMAVRPMNGVSSFYYQLLLSKRRLFEDLAMGNLIPGLSRGDILDMKTPLPMTEEQQKIAHCLTSFDTQITAQAKQIQSLKAHKRGLMQQLFPSPEGGG